MEKAERMLDQASQEDQKDMINLIMDILSGEDRVALPKAMKELPDILFYLES